MTQQQQFFRQTLTSPLLVKRALMGAALGLGLIALFLLPIKTPHPEFGPFWMVRPFILVTLAGAAAGCCHHMLDIVRQQGRTQKIIANILAVFIYVIGLFLGFVLGLDGTLWD